jgi:hypothetical protein
MGLCALGQASCLKLLHPWMISSEIVVRGGNTHNEDQNSVSFELEWTVDSATKTEEATCASRGRRLDHYQKKVSDD